MELTEDWKKVSCRGITVATIAILATAGWLVAVYYIRQVWDIHHMPAEAGCSKKAKDDCQDFIEGNYCVETDHPPYFRCNCTAQGYVVHDEHYCLSVKCTDWDDMYACKAHVKGNSCKMDLGVHRNCSCGAPGYQLKESKRGNICWRTKCTSYQEDQCHSDIQGNTCAVLDDVFQCSCSAKGYKNEPEREQRCLLISTPRPTTTMHYYPITSHAQPITNNANRLIAALTQAIATSLVMLLTRILV